MKKIYLLVLGVLAAAVVGAENVSSVSFNPARLGNYEHLKVSGRASFPGGLQSDNLNLGSSITGNFSPDESEIRLDSPDTTPISANSVFGDKGENSFIKMPSALFIKDANQAPCNFATGVCNFPSRSEPIDTANWFGTKVYMSSGTMEFGDSTPGATGPASFIKELYANELLLQRADMLNVNFLDVSGNVTTIEPDGIAVISPESVGKEVQLLQANGTRSSTQLLKLAGVNIPYPDVNSVRYNPGDGDATKPKAYETAFQPFDDASMDDCQLRWVKRKITPQPGETDQYVHVLALAGDCKLSCTPTPPISNYELGECPPGTTGNAKRKVVTQTLCNNGVAETQVTYPDGENGWDFSGCSSQPKWVWKNAWANNYESDWKWRDTGKDTIFGYLTGVNDTRCATNGGNPRLWLGDSMQIIPGWFEAVFKAIYSPAALLAGVWDEYWDTWLSKYTNIKVKRLFKNYMGGNRSDVADAHSHKVRTGDKVQNAPACTSNNIGDSIEESVYFLKPKIGMRWPVSCKGWGVVNQYKCE